MAYRAVGFDYGGVLVGVAASGNFKNEILELLQISPEEYERTYFKHYKKMNRGEISWKGLWKIILAELGQPEKLSALMRVSEKYFPADREINREVLALAKKLKNKGYKVGILSNNSKVMAEKMRRDFGHLFSVIQVSAETGYVKPEPVAFQHFAEALSVELDELIFIDDAENSLSTAKQCGFAPILYEDDEKLKADLKKLGVL